MKSDGEQGAAASSLAMALAAARKAAANSPPGELHVEATPSTSSLASPDQSASFGMPQEQPSSVLTPIMPAMGNSQPHGRSSSLPLAKPRPRPLLPRLVSGEQLIVEAAH